LDIQTLAAADQTSWATPLAVFGFGLGLFYGVQYFLKVVEDNLSADTKLEIAVWLLDLHPPRGVERWPSTLVKLFERVFGEKQLSLKCVWRSCAASVLTSVVILSGLFVLNFESIFLGPYHNRWWVEFGITKFFLFCFSAALISNLIPDYFSLWKTRALLNLSEAHPAIIIQTLSFLVDLFVSLIIFVISGWIAAIAFVLLYFLFGYKGDVLGKPIETGAVLSVFLLLLPACLGRLWLLLYLVSGLILKLSRKADIGSDIGFNWFNKKFDIEHRPLQCVGLITGAIVTLFYWIIAAITLASNVPVKGV
jgi:hypothetical protein